MGSNTEVEVNFDRIKRKTISGWWVEVGEGFDAEEFFLPESLTDMGEDGTFALIPEWLALEKGLI